MHNANTGQIQRGLRLLALDDGGIRGISELVIIQEIMYRLKHLEKAASVPKPCDFFDIIGGVGTGGVIALMLGRLRMPIDLAIEKYVDFSKKVYSDIKRFGTGPERFKASTFVSEMEDILKSVGFPIDVLMQEDNASCKSFVTALPSADMTPRIFRTYEVKANQGYNCTVVEAARATTAAPELFKPVSISSGGLNEEFIGARLGYNNPTSLVLEEAELVFGASHPVTSIVSIGAGHPGYVSWKPMKLFTQRLVKVLLDISTNCEIPAEDLVKRYKNLPGIFYRLNVDQGLQKMALDDWNRLGEIKTHSVNYLQRQEISQKVDSLVDTLHNHPQKITLGMLINHSSHPTPHFSSNEPTHILPHQTHKEPTTKPLKHKAAEKAEKASRAIGKRDPNAPKRALSAYMFFSQEWRERIKAEKPDAGFGEAGKLLGTKWMELDDEEKKPYFEQAAKDKTRAEEEKAAYDDAPSFIPFYTLSCTHFQQAKKFAVSNDDDEEQQEETDD